MIDGVRVALATAFDSTYRSEFFENHKPLTSLRWYDPHRYIASIRYRGAPLVGQKWLSTAALPYLTAHSRDLSGFKFAVFCGGPVVQFSPSAGIRLMLAGQMGAFATQNVTVLSLGLGSGGYALQSLRDPKDGLSREARDFYSFLGSFGPITVRDAYAHDVLTAARIPSTLVPCPASLVGWDIQKRREPHTSFRRLIVNYQYWGANESWGQEYEPSQWASTIRGLVKQARRDFEVVFLAHNAYEGKLARALDLDVEIFQPRNSDEFARIAVSACGAVTNRIHAAIPLAGAGVPVYTVGVDTRLGSVALLGGRTAPVWETELHDLLAWLDGLKTDTPLGNMQGVKMREYALKQYVLAMTAPSDHG